LFIDKELGALFKQKIYEGHIAFASLKAMTELDGEAALFKENQTFSYISYYA